MLVIGSRGSQLALWQAKHVRERLLQQVPGATIELLGDGYGVSLSPDGTSALVIVPGTAISFCGISAFENFCFATSIGP